MTNKNYLYRFNYMPQNKELAYYEMQAIFNEKINSDWILTTQNINPNKSYFLNYQIEVMNTGKTISELIASIKADELYYEAFKIEFVDVSDETLVYKERIQACIDISWVIDGYGVMKNPAMTFVVTQYNDLWYFGKLNRNDRSFLKNTDKPHSYSNAMTGELSRALVNIACGQNQDIKLLDPCCGIGTVVAEALSQGYDIVGRELNYDVATKAQANLEHLGFENVIRQQDMHTITEHYDVAIMDLPYGLFSTTSLELQAGLITKCHDLADKLLLVAMENSDELIANAHWKVQDKITVPKKDNGGFERYIYILVK